MLANTYRGRFVQCLVVLFCLLSSARTYTLAHTHEAADAHAHNSTVEGISVKNATEYPSTYFTHPEHVGTIYAHITLMVLAWVFVLPIAVMFSIAKSRYTLIIQFIFLCTNAVGVTLAIVYKTKTPDLYPNNAHHKIGWIITWVISAHVLVNLLNRIANACRRHNTQDEEEQHTYLYTRFRQHGDCTPDYQADDSGQSASSQASSIRSGSISTICAEDRYLQGERHKEDSSEDEFENLPLSSPSSSRTRLAAKVARIVSSRAWMYVELGYNVVDRIILPFGFITLTTGIVTFARFFEGNGIFGGLAHWIKGGVFFWLGLFSLGRWSGSFAELGWAWNLRPKMTTAQPQHFCPSAEFIESSLILFYGSTNVFLEHIGGWGGEWTAQDLEHVAITLLFIGGGLCGIFVESTRIRDLLNTTVKITPSHSYSDEGREQLGAPETYELSLNPIPSLVILLLGIIMGSHHQSTMTASMVHKQWGTLLLWASVARGLTYVLFYLKPPKSVLPSRPPTELLASFGLIAGGIIFMASSSDTVAGMIHYDLDAMFLYVVTMGLVGMLMAWEITVLAIKGWAVRKERSSNI